MWENLDVDAVPVTEDDPHDEQHFNASPPNVEELLEHLRGRLNSKYLLADDDSGNEVLRIFDNSTGTRKGKGIAYFAADDKAAIKCSHATEHLDVVDVCPILGELTRRKWSKRHKDLHSRTKTERFLADLATEWPDALESRPTNPASSRQAAEV
jgi:hypothetical protein